MLKPQEKKATNLGKKFENKQWVCVVFQRPQPPIFSLFSFFSIVCTYSRPLSSYALVLVFESWIHTGLNYEWVTFHSILYNTPILWLLFWRNKFLNRKQQKGTFTIQNSPNLRKNKRKRGKRSLWSMSWVRISKRRLGIN